MCSGFGMLIAIWTFYTFRSKYLESDALDAERVGSDDAIEMTETSRGGLSQQDHRIRNDAGEESDTNESSRSRILDPGTGRCSSLVTKSTHNFIIATFCDSFVLLLIYFLLE
jgi:hypothetical protein